MAATVPRRQTLRRQSHSMTHRHRSCRRAGLTPSNGDGNLRGSQGFGTSVGRSDPLDSNVTADQSGTPWRSLRTAVNVVVNVKFVRSA